MSEDGSRKLVVAMAWYKEEDYQRIRKLSGDEEEMCETWEEWRENAQESLRRFVAEGRPVEKVFIEPEELQSWCASRLKPIDGSARSQFASWKLQQRDEDVRSLS